MGKAKYKRVTDLYVDGKVVVLKDGTPLWIQVLNPFERGEAQTDAQISKARLTLAMRDHASDMHARAKSSFESVSPEEAVDLLVEFRAGEAMVKAVDGIKNDEDWAERLSIMERSEDILSRPIEDAERELLNKINQDYVVEVQRRFRDELDYVRDHLSGLDREGLWEDYLEQSIEAQGSKAAMDEYRLCEVWLGCRSCEGTQGEDGWEHEACDGHRERAFEEKREVRELPEELYELLLSAYDEVQMQVREAKNSDRQGSSSGSSPLPSVEAESTASTQDETPSEPLGTSAQPLTTPSRS